MNRLTVLLEPMKKFGMDLWVPLLISDGKIHTTPERVQIIGKNRLEILAEQLIVHLEHPLPSEETEPGSRFTATSLFKNYQKPIGGFPRWRIRGDFTGTHEGYTRLRNVQLYGIQDMPSRWCTAILGPNVDLREPILTGGHCEDLY